MFSGKQYLPAKYFRYTRGWEQRISNLSFRSLYISMDTAS